MKNPYIDEHRDDSIDGLAGDLPEFKSKRSLPGFKNWKTILSIGITSVLFVFLFFFSMSIASDKKEIRQDIKMLKDSLAHGQLRLQILQGKISKIEEENIKLKLEVDTLREEVGLDPL